MLSKRSEPNGNQTEKSSESQQSYGHHSSRNLSAYKVLSGDNDFRFDEQAKDLMPLDRFVRLVLTDEVAFVLINERVGPMVDLQKRSVATYPEDARRYEQALKRSEAEDRRRRAEYERHQKNIDLLIRRQRSVLRAVIPDLIRRHQSIQIGDNTTHALLSSPRLTKSLSYLRLLAASFGQGPSRLAQWIPGASSLLSVRSRHGFHTHDPDHACMVCPSTATPATQKKSDTTSLAN